jgi:iduronate 2-sulfatase
VVAHGGGSLGQRFNQAEKLEVSIRFIIFGFLLLLSGLIRGDEGRSKLNVLFIAIDDLRPALGCYGDSLAMSPNIDRLAGEGALFRNAHCQQAVCCPSRLSLLTGRRPDSTKVWDLATHFREALPNIVTLPQCFKEQGYDTRSIGKVLHGSGKPAKDSPSWSHEPVFDVTRDPTLRYASPVNLVGKGLKRAASESTDVLDDVYVDGKVCQLAVEALEAYSKLDQPFFLAVGFRKPHLPFCAPKRYWDLYTREQFELPSSEYPIGAPEFATRSWMELEGYPDIPENGDLTPEKIEELRHGYYACVSYVDAMVGRLTQVLRELSLANKTVIVLWGDHGFHLGEQGLWAKANNFELSTRVPLIVSVPGSKPGVVSDGLVELVDLYPTLAEVCGLSISRGLEGTSFKPLLSDPDLKWKSAVFSQYPRAYIGNRHRGGGDVMGYSIRSKRYRFVEWRDQHSREILAQELYDLGNAKMETVNIAENPAFGPVVELMKNRMRAGWREARPKN